MKRWQFPGIRRVHRNPGLGLVLSLVLVVGPGWSLPAAAAPAPARAALPASPGTVSGHTTVYRWTDAAGVRHYAAEPPEPNAQPAALPPLQVYRADAPGPGPALPRATLPQDTPPTTVSARLTAPADGQVFLAGSAVAVAVEVSPGLPKTPGGVIFELDGRPLTREPQPDRMTMAAPAPGEHRLVARVVDALGRTSGTSMPVGFAVQAVPVEAIDAFMKGPGGR